MNNQDVGMFFGQTLMSALQCEARDWVFPACNNAHRQKILYPVGRVNLEGRSYCFNYSVTH